MKIIYSIFIILLAGFVMAGGHSLGGNDKCYVDKIDDLAVNGLSGIRNSLAYKVEELEKHFHSRERWFGISADQAGADWNESVSDASMPDIFTAISGNDTYGADANDEAKVIGTGDTCGITGMTKFDLHRIVIIDASATTFYILRIVYGSDTLANNITAGQYSEVVFQRNTGAGEAHGTPLAIQMPRLTWGTDKVWIQAKNTTDNADVDFFFGLHCYKY